MKGLLHIVGAVRMLRFSHQGPILSLQQMLLAQVVVGNTGVPL